MINALLVVGVSRASSDLRSHRLTSQPRQPWRSPSLIGLLVPYIHTAISIDVLPRKVPRVDLCICTTVAQAQTGWIRLC